MGAPDNASTGDAIAPQGEAAPALDATYNPRDVAIGPASGQDAAALWAVKPSADLDARQDVNGGPPDSSAAAPANPDGADSTGDADNTDSTAAYDAAAQRVKTQNAQTCSQAALMLSAQGGAPVPDQALADYFHVSLPVVTQNREQFRNAYNRNQSWRALSGCSVLPGFIVAHPLAAPAVKHDLLSWSTLEGLFSESAHNLEEGAGAIAEPILHHGTGLIASPLSHVAGLGATAYEALLSDEDNSQEIDGFVRHVRDSWTYQPRTEAGASPVNPLNSIPTWFGMLLNFALPDKAEDGDTASGMFRNGIREAIPQALGIVGPKLPFYSESASGGRCLGYRRRSAGCTESRSPARGR